MAQLETLIFGDTPPPDDFGRDLEQNLDKIFQSLRTILNKGILFADNVNCFITTITTNATPGLQTAIAHGLKRIPTGCLVAEKNKAAHIYLGASGKDATNYNVASDIASVTATLIIF